MLRRRLGQKVKSIFSRRQPFGLRSNALARMVDALVVVCLIGVLSGCYGSSVSKMCQVCVDSKEGKAEGAEWSGEYISEKFQCKLEGGKVKVQIKDYWKDCG